MNIIWCNNARISLPIVTRIQTHHLTNAPRARALLKTQNNSLSSLEVPNMYRFEESCDFLCLHPLKGHSTSSRQTFNETKDFMNFNKECISMACVYTVDLL